MAIGGYSNAYVGLVIAQDQTGLTETEWDILWQSCHGTCRKELARERHVRPATIKSQLSVIYRKLAERGLIAPNKNSHVVSCVALYQITRAVDMDWDTDSHGGT